MSDFQFKELDIDGWQTLDVIAKAEKFNSWMYETIKPFCRGKVLEIGSGIGNISLNFVRDNFDITLTDIRLNYCELLKRNFPTVENILQLDLMHPQFDSQYKDHIGKYDTVFAMNVVEHIEKDELALSNCYKLLKHQGNCIILVPAYQCLYNRFDKELEHYRRYTKRTLNNLVSKCDFEIIHSQYFNFIGIFGWYMSGKLQGNKTIPKNQMSLYNSLVPIFKVIDKCVFNSVGLSVISVGKISKHQVN
jgi:2-polyprenyl-3-methyl-5-hydroxy-6-metoxy-1,4-benzoquinol methylase